MTGQGRKKRLPRSADASTERALLLHFYFATAAPSFLAQTDSFFTRSSQPRSNVIVIMSRVVTVLAFSVFFGFRVYDIFVRFFFGLSGPDYYVNEGYLV